MHQAQWSPERPLPPPVSLASQSHHEKPPEVVFFHFVGKYSHSGTGPFDVTAGGIVTAFNQCRHGKYHLVMHFKYLCSLFLDLVYKLIIECVDKFYVLLVLGIIGYEKVIAPVFVSVKQKRDADKIYFIIFFVIELAS